MTASSKSRQRVLSGMRSTGKLHLGNYVGALQNWVRMQDEYECFFMVADWHALTTDYADTSRIKENSLEVVLDWLAAGLDPEKSVIFIQSHVPAHAELHLLFSMITPLGWLERVPTYKEQRENIKDKDLGTYGFLGYPLLQAADILIYKANVVPVGEDNRLVKAGEVAPIEPKAFRVLLFLLHNPQRLITKEELLDAVWADAAVTESSLTRSIAKLRRVLGDDFQEPRYINTVATVGYRFIGKVEVSEDPSGDAQAKTKEPDDLSD